MDMWLFCPRSAITTYFYSASLPVSHLFSEPRLRFTQKSGHHVPETDGVIEDVPGPLPSLSRQGSGEDTLKPWMDGHTLPLDGGGQGCPNRTLVRRAGHGS